MKTDPIHRYQVLLDQPNTTETIIDTDDFELAVRTYNRTLKNTRDEGLPNKVELFDFKEDEAFFRDEQELSDKGRMMNDESI